jgi:hypothetical protein
MWNSDDKNIKMQMGTKASAWVSNKAVELNGKQKEGKVERRGAQARLALTAKQVGVNEINQWEGQRQRPGIQGPFPDSVPSRYNSCFSIYTRERWTVFGKLLS